MGMLGFFCLFLIYGTELTYVEVIFLPISVFLRFVDFLSLLKMKSSNFWIKNPWARLLR